MREAIRVARLGDRRQARSILAEYTQDHGDDPLGWLWRAGVAHTPDLALLWLDQLLEREPDHEVGKQARHLVAMQAGIAAARSGDRQTARKRFLEATISDPTDYLAWLELAQYAKSIDEKRSSLETALRLKPDHEPARRVLAELPFPTGEGNHDHLIEIFDDAPDSSPSRDVDVRPQVTSASGPIDSSAPESRSATSSRTSSRGKSTPVLGQGNPAHHAMALIVDEDADHRQSLRVALEKRNVRGLTATGASQALVEVRDRGIPNLILIDADLTEIDGCRLCGYLRKNAELANVPIVLMASRVGLMLRGEGGPRGGQRGDAEAAVAGNDRPPDRSPLPAADAPGDPRYDGSFDDFCRRPQRPAAPRLAVGGDRMDGRGAAAELA